MPLDYVNHAEDHFVQIATQRSAIAYPAKANAKRK